MKHPSVIAELVGTTEAASKEKAKRTRVDRAKRDFGFFCKTYLGDYFFTDPAEYQRVLYDVADTQSLSPQVAEKLKTFVAAKYYPYLKPTPRLAGAMFIEPREHGKTVRWSFAYAPVARAVGEVAICAPYRGVSCCRQKKTSRTSSASSRRTRQSSRISGMSRGTSGETTGLSSR